MAKKLEKIRDNEKRIEQLKEEYEIVLNNTQDAMYLIEVDREQFKFLRVNTYYEELTGRKTSEIKGKTPDEIFESEKAMKIKNKYKLK